MPEEPVTKFGVTIGKRVTCYNPDGSSWVCTSRDAWPRRAGTWRTATPSIIVRKEIGLIRV